MYTLYKTIDVRDLNRSCLRTIDICINISNDSDFVTSMRLGACIRLNNSYFKGGNTHRIKAGGVVYKSLHAEMSALLRMIKLYDRKANFNSDIKFHGAKLYVVRVMSKNTKSGHKLGTSKPCNHCQFYLNKFNITKIYYIDIIDNMEHLCEMRSV